MFDFMNRRIVSAGVVVIANFAMTTSLVYAHPGHGVVSSSSDSHSLIHYFTEPFHAVGFFGCLMLSIAATSIIARCRAAARVGR